MTYRRSQDDGVFSSRWRIAHRAKLHECGVPSNVTRNDRLWTYVLLHDHDPDTGWRTSWLSDEQAEALLELLRPHFDNPIGVCLVEALLRRCRSSGATDTP